MIVLFPPQHLEAPRDYVVWDRIGRSVVIARQDDGSAAARHNVCQHRGARLVDNGLVVLKKDTVEADRREAVRRAAYGCPTNAIIYAET